GPDHGDLRRPELWKRRSGADPSGRARGAESGIYLFYCRGRFGMSAAGAVPGPVLFRRRGYSRYDAMGENLYLYVRGIFYSVKHDLYFPQYYAGVRIRIPADDGRRFRIGGQ